MSEDTQEKVAEQKRKINEIIAFLKKNRAERNDPGYCDIPQPLQ